MAHPRTHVMTILGTRPEIIRLSEVIKACDRCFTHTLVHTGQNWDRNLSGVFFEELGLRQPDHFLQVAGAHLGETIGNIIARSYSLLAETRPDALLVLGDTNSALCALSAKRLKIPIFHMEAGNRCFDQNVPEEINRRIVDHLSDVNMPYTEHGRRYLLDEGIRKDHIFVTGSPMPEVLRVHERSIASSDVLQRLALEAEAYFLVSAHREENVCIDGSFRSLVGSLNAVAEHYGMPVVYSTHPRPRQRLAEEGVVLHDPIRSVEPLGFFDYNCLQKHAFCVLSDSGTVSEESSILGFPAVLIRTSTERPEVLDKGSIVIGGIEPEGVLRAIEMARALFGEGTEFTRPLDYQDGNVSAKVVRIVESYGKIVNRVTWNRALGGGSL